MIFYGPSGVGTAHGYSAYRTHVLGALDAAFASRSFELDVLTCEGSICGAHGRLRAEHVGCYLGAHPTATADGGHAPAQVSMRLGLHWHIVDGKALDGYMMHDAPALFRDHFGVDVSFRVADFGHAQTEEEDEQPVTLYDFVWDKVGRMFFPAIFSDKG